MNLDEAQIARVRQWIDQGLKVSDVQSRLADELGVRLTYMEARLLLDDLKLRPKDAPKSPKAADTVIGATAGAAPGKPAIAPPQGTPPGPSNSRLAVSVDEINRPGALVSGKVTFRDGQLADWQLDQFGRLSVIPKKQGYKPSQAEVSEFQVELDSVLARLGY